MIAPIDDVLYIICPVFNPARFKSRYRLFQEFKERMEKTKKVVLTTVELAFGERPFFIPPDSYSNTLHLRTTSEIWHKEAMINQGVQYILSNYPGAKYFAWIDGDVEFIGNPNWVDETLHQLQHFSVVQMWADAVDLGPDGEILGRHESFMKGYINGGFVYPNEGLNDYYGTRNGKQFFHTGFAFAATLNALQHLGGLLDFAILGSADNNMCAGLVGSIEKTFTPGLSERYKKKLLLWQERAEDYIQRNVGYVPLSLIHYWHGSKRTRYYNTRSQILAKYQFDPDLDLKRDLNGLYILTDRSSGLRDALRAYMRSRKEDSIDL